MARSDDAQHDLDDLGALIRAHRKRAGLTGAEAARRAGFTQSKMSKIENGILLPGADDVRRLAVGLSMDADATAHALDLIDRVQDDQPARRITLRRDTFAEHAALLAKFRGAGYVVAADPAVVPDWLRTRDYLFAATGPLSQRNTRTATALLRKRQDLIATPSVRFEFFVFETALRNRVGPAQLMSEQMLELAAITARHPNVIVRVVPREAVITPALLHGFEVHDDEQVVITMTPGVMVITTEDDVQPFRRMTTALRACAMDEGSSRSSLQRIALAYRSNALTEKYAA
ncbi:Scr1 family TA system antitoxin-like transcriptional regulator [Lentzea aerocolonigenes]|uniref:Scr1 family TA system antitoxin-like transcriptional regulator n=1 Tax=Lentzea aerocolonigenes TaxID=68170 RepID=UPI0004C30E2D|nr:Scr1 family TA system antitoxin-like transcriptional regulator [Lentzea aerocolonigenes]MCP2243660.1 Transcriptional regulator, contains XRE-family HTH domain [Lentzea aerocolonigenes]